MTKKLLVTDSFFIKDNHIDQLKNAGYDVVHLDKSVATEQELIDVIKDISVYILGGSEQVTDAVIAASDKLETIIFCGVDYDKFIPGAAAALSRGITLLNAPGANATAVMEFALGVVLMMQRRLISISRIGDQEYLTTGSLQKSTIGIIGAGNIGVKIMDTVKSFEPNEIIYYNRTPKELFARQVELDELVQTADIIFLALPMKAGCILNSELIAKLKKGSLLMSISPVGLIDFDALLPRLQNKEIRAAIDWPSPSKAFDELPLENWYSVTSHSGYDTAEAVQGVANSVTTKAISLLENH